MYTAIDFDEMAQLISGDEIIQGLFEPGTFHVGWMTSRNLQGIKEFCGRCTAIPLVKLAEETYSPPDFPPKLEWYKFKSQRDSGGSLLAAFELIEVRYAILIDIRPAREPHLALVLMKILHHLCPS